MDNQLIDIPIGQKTFTANGKVYTKEESISIDRWKQYEKLQVEVGYNASFQQIFTLLRECWDEANNMQFGKVCIILHNLMSSVKDNLEDKANVSLRMCALFINTEGEDRKTISEEQIQAKISDWVAAGISMNSFFVFATSLIPNFASAFKEVSQDTFPESQPNQSPKTGN